MRFSISHSSVYRYSKAARSNQNELRLSPLEDDWQNPGEISFQIEPQPVGPIRSWHDTFGNLTHWFEVEDPHYELSILATSEVETLPPESSPQAAFQTDLLGITEEMEQEEPSLHDFLADSLFVKRDPAIWRQALDLVAESESNYGAVLERFSHWIFDHCTFDPSYVPQTGTALEVLEMRRGICQDFSHLMLGLCRAIKVPARYVSGYLFEPEVLEADPDEHLSHAWVETFLPEVGWIGVDPTNRQWVDERYIRVAYGRDYYDVPPVKGTLIGGGQNRELKVKVLVSEVVSH
ncbi:MAG: transglutaminase family protein [Verrucomicrobiota bacterium]